MKLFSSLCVTLFYFLLSFSFEYSNIIVEKTIIIPDICSKSIFALFPVKCKVLNDYRNEFIRIKTN